MEGGQESEMPIMPLFFFSLPFFLLLFLILSFVRHYLLPYRLLTSPIFQFHPHPPAPRPSRPHAPPKLHACRRPPPLCRRSPPPPPSATPPRGLHLTRVNGATSSVATGVALPRTATHPLPAPSLTVKLPSRAPPPSSSSPSRASPSSSYRQAISSPLPCVHC